jgi:hypothetical protein
MALFTRRVTPQYVLSAVDAVRLQELGRPSSNDLEAMVEKMIGNLKNWFFVVETMSWLGGVIRERVPRERLDPIINDSLERALIIAGDWVEHLTGARAETPNDYALVAIRELVSHDFLARPDQLQDRFLAKYEDDAVSSSTRLLYLPTLVAAAGCIAAQLDMSFEYS